MYTIRIPVPAPKENQVLDRIEVVDLSTGGVVAECEPSINLREFTFELEGDKYDNRLNYRFVSINGVDGEERQTTLTPIAPGGLRGALAVLDPSTDGTFDLDILTGVSPKEMSYLCRNILTNAYHKILLKVDRKSLENYECFLASFPPEIMTESPEARYVHQLLSILLSYVKRCESQSNPVAKLDESTVDRIIVNYCRANHLPPEQIPAQPGLLVAKGHIMGLTDRQLAAKSYSDAIKMGDDFIDTFLRVDALTTYFGSIPSGFSPNIVAFREYDCANDVRTNVCFSVDEKYFKMYAPLWAATSVFYKDHVFNYLIVTETREEFETLAQGYEDLLLSTEKFVSGNARSNVRLFWLKNEKSLGRTLYACARFYLATKVLQDTTGDVFVSDIDQIVVGDLAKFLRERKSVDSDVQLALVENYFAILPGRSHLAGYIYMRNTSSAQTFANDVTDYIAAGLGVDFSWMLDQNAVRYGAERTQVSHLDMRSVRIFGHYGAHKDALRARLARVVPNTK